MHNTSSRAFVLCCATYIAAAAAIAVSVIKTTGGYFFNGLDALEHYPQWSEAFALAKKAGWPTGSAAADLTMFVPGESAMHHQVTVCSLTGTALPDLQQQGQPKHL
jgi:hypothetical protein